MPMTGITIAIAAIPEGLPATVTIALALAVSRMMKHGALGERHSGNPGCASVICSDKTGTITENRMIGQPSGSPGHGHGRIAGTFTGRPHGQSLGEASPAGATGLRFSLQHSGTASGAFLRSHMCFRSQRTERGSWHAVGDPTEAALLVAAEKAGYPLKKALRCSTCPHATWSRLTARHGAWR